MIHNPRGNSCISVFLSRNVHKGGDRIVQNNDSLVTDNLFARPWWQRSCINKTSANSQRDNANLSIFFVNDKAYNFNIFRDTLLLYILS